MMKGIDVSKWQGKIDWQRVKAAGIEFAIIRAGYGSSANQKDSFFERNYTGAKAAGLHVGAYWYSYANSFREAIEEAKAFQRVIAGKQFDMPVYFDMEEKDQLEAGRDFCSGLIRTFCSEMEKAGYFAGFYTSASYAKTLVSPEILRRYTFWCAQWAGSCSYQGRCGIWQHSSKGSVPGIDGNVDLDRCYQDFPKVIRNGGFNGYPKCSGGGVKKVLSDRQRIVAQAQAWIGKKEIDGSHREIIDIYNGHKPLARGYAVKYSDAWCAVFVSAVAIKCGVTNIIPTECGCGQMLMLFKILGELVEEDNYRPSPGDVVFYDWQDSGIGDNAGWPDHVGIVEKVEGNIITVIEGNKANEVGRRKLNVGGKFIRAYGVPKYKAVAFHARVNERGLQETESEPVYYRVKNGDTLWEISQKFGTTVDAIQKLNTTLIKNSNLIITGWKIRVK